MKGDERILGDSEYVIRALWAANENLKRKYQLNAHGLGVDQVAEKVAALLGLPVGEIWAAGKQHNAVEAHSLLCYWSGRQLGVSMSSLTRRLGISPTSVSRSVLRGQRLAKNRAYQL